jgi:hypothetical protein
MDKIDYKKKLKHLYNSSAKVPSVVEVPDMKFLMIDGEGDPNTSQCFKDAVEALYSTAYTLKFMLKPANLLPYDYVVPPLEGLWWMDDMNLFSLENKYMWKWTLMIMQPEFITEEHVANAIKKAGAKKSLPALPGIRFEKYAEGLSAQIMHIGPFAEEGPTIEKLHRFIQENGYQRNEKHHEIYLSDFRKTAPEKLKTIIRQPMNN